jgi:aminoglycoside 2'-N-acetyltransferase I
VTDGTNGDRVLRLPTGELSERQVSAIRELLWAAFADDPHGGFTEDDWQHALGGVHFLLERQNEVLVHASVVERELHLAGRPTRTGYVEAVATAPTHQGMGLGTRVMREVGAHIAATYELGALGTGSHGFYERLGWRTWRGPSSVRTPGGERPTPDEDGYIMVLATPTSPALELTAPISCEWRPGDVW